jgi:hypothetical protein
MSYRLSSYRLSICCLGWLLVALFLTGCTHASPPDISPMVETPEPAQPLPTQVPAATRLPSATAVVFELRPSSTSIPSPSPLPRDMLPGFGYGPTDFPEGINPLTGLPVADPGLLNRRPMAIKISNFPRQVRPQWGLMSADHVYEYYLEDGLTRFFGIFYGRDASRVGPVRSARLFDAHIVRMYKAIFAFGYADDQVIDELMASEFKNLLVVQRPDNCPPMCRIETGDNYNNLFTDTAQLSQYVTQRGDTNERQNLDGLRFEKTNLLTLSANPAERITIRFSDYSYNLWEYDPGSERYYRSQEDDTRPPGQEVYQPLIDSLTNEQVAADNIIILFVNTTEYFKSKSTTIYSINLVGQGEGYALRNGKIFKIQWKRVADDFLLVLEFAGQPFPLKPGNVWFEVLGETATEGQLGNSAWEFTHSFP